jgi:hypothetical protein
MLGPASLVMIDQERSKVLRRVKMAKGLDEGAPA